MKLDERTKERITVGAAIMANSQPFLKYHSKIALAEGSDAVEIPEAFGAGKRVRKGVVTRMDLFISEQEKPAPCHRPAKALSSGCCS